MLSIKDRELLLADGAVTVREAGAFLSLSRTTIWRLMDSGALPFVYIKAGGNHGTRRIPKRALVTWAAGRLLGT